MASSFLERHCLYENTQVNLERFCYMCRCTDYMFYVVHTSVDLLTVNMNLKRQSQTESPEMTVLPVNRKMKSLISALIISLPATIPQ